jgi:hypothetical protein
MDAIIAQCEARFGRRVQVLDHPILGPLTAPQWRKLHLVHGRHHQKQVPSGKRAEVNGRARARVRFFPYSIIPLAQLFTAIYINTSPGEPICLPVLDQDLARVAFRLI